MQRGLAGIRVLDFSEQIAGPYCTKLLIDGGAEVVKVERRAGDTLRSWSASGADLGGRDSALFAFLNAGKKSVVGSLDDAAVERLLGEADLVVEAHGLESDCGVAVDVEALRAAYPSLVIVSITPYGRSGPWAGRRATEFTLQAESGSIGMRGLMGEQPFQAGGRITEWAAGAYAAAAALPALMRARQTGHGEHVDLSMLETANIIFTNFSETMNRMMNGSPDDPEHAFLTWTVETPSIEPTADGYVGFCTNSRQQFSDFLLMIERPDLQDDEELAQVAGRLMRFDEWNETMRPWLSSKTTAKVVELASALRIPVAPVCNGETVTSHEQLQARRVFRADAGGGFQQPRRPYLIDGEEPPAPRVAPRLGQHASAAVFENDGETPTRMLDGVRILDLTAWWAGPAATHFFAALGAEVIHVESTRRPDGLRMIGGMMAAHYPEWWEASPHFLHVNANKLSVSLNLNQERGRELLDRLLAECDAIVENFTPRVLENFGITWEHVQSVNPHAVMMRMPAFGLDGPWRDNTGFAQTMEQVSGMAWVTGHLDDQPRIPRGPCDPIAGMHCCVALIVALAERAATGRGHHVESTMVESALNIAAEQVIEWSAYGNLLERDGNRSPLAAPQGLYPCADGQPGTESWMALSIATDEQWHTLCAAMGEPGWAVRAELAAQARRAAAHDELDERISEWTRTRRREDLVAELRALGIPASALADPCRLLQTNPQLRSRHFFETPEHPVVGAMPVPGLPFRYADTERWIRRAAPTLGQDNQRVLCDLLGLSGDEIAQLEASGVTGTRPLGV